MQNEPEPIVYLLQSQVSDGATATTTGILPLTWAFRTRGIPEALRPAVQEELRIASGGLAVGRVRTMEAVMGRSLARHDFNTLLITLFAAAALLLSSIGVYGLMTYTVQQRTQEMGVRIALGATPGHIRRLVLRQGLRLALTGVAIGCAGTLAMHRVMRGFVYGVAATDPLSLSLATGVLVAVALLACYLPAKRATALDPVRVLRSE